MKHLWHRVGNLPDLATPSSGCDASIEFDFLVSPYDVPDAIRGWKTKEGRFRIDFRYIDGPEPHETKCADQHIELLVGKYTGRLLGVDIDVQALGVEQVGVQISIADFASTVVEDTWGSLRKDSASTIENLAQVEQAFAKRRDEVMQGFCSDK